MPVENPKELPRKELAGKELFGKELPKKELGGQSAPVAEHAETRGIECFDVFCWKSSVHELMVKCRKE